MTCNLVELLYQLYVHVQKAQLYFYNFLKNYANMIHYNFPKIRFFCREYIGFYPDTDESILELLYSRREDSVCELHSPNTVW
jgi:hypothetical protein